MELHDAEWGRKGATLSDKTARAEFGLKQVNRELKQLRAQVAALEEKRSVLLAELGWQGPGSRDENQEVRLNRGGWNVSATWRGGEHDRRRARWMP